MIKLDPLDFAKLQLLQERVASGQRECELYGLYLNQKYEAPYGLVINADGTASPVAPPSEEGLKAVP